MPDTQWVTAGTWIPLRSIQATTVGSAARTNDLAVSEVAGLMIKALLRPKLIIQNVVHRPGTGFGQVVDLDLFQHVADGIVPGLFPPSGIPQVGLQTGGFGKATMSCS